jgi:Uma2 family endonuclease
MATITPPTETSAEASDDCVVLHGVDWKGYTSLLRIRGDRPSPKMVYLDGDLYLMSPDYPHEFLKERLGLFVMVVVEELDIPCIPAGETTFRRRKKKGGVEGDKTFYLANVARIRGKRHENLHLRHDPPPDLVVEAVNTHEADEAVEVWRRFGVPEVWVCDHQSVRILVLQPDRSYAGSNSSASFPFLTAAEIFEQVNRPETESETAWVKDVRRWVRETLPPRVPKPKGDA